MSVRVMSMVWAEFPRGGAQLLAMLALADFANDAGESVHPSMRTLAKKLRVSRRQAQKLLRELEAAGFIVAAGSAAGGKQSATRRFRIRLDRLTGEHIDTGEQNDTGEDLDAHGCRKRHGTGEQNDTQSTKEPSRTTKRSLTRFDSFWEVYPKKVKKKPSADKWKAKKLDRIADTIIADVQTRIERDRRWLDGYVPDPTTYLNQERWNDELDTGERLPNRGNGRLQESPPARKELE